MDTRAIQSRKATVERQHVEEIARRSRAGGTSEILFKNTAPVVELLKTAPADPVKPVSPAAPTASAGSLDVILRTMSEGFAKLAAAAKGAAPIQKAPAAPKAVPQPIPMEIQRTAKRVENDRGVVAKTGSQVKTLRTFDPSLSDAALMVLIHVAKQYEANKRHPVPVDGSDLSRALELPLTAAQAGFTELVDKGHLASSKNSLGVIYVTPNLTTAGV